MPITISFISKSPVRKKIIKQFKSRESAQRAIDALKSKFNYTFYRPIKRKFR